MGHSSMFRATTLVAVVCLLVFPASGFVAHTKIINHPVHNRCKTHHSPVTTTITTVIPRRSSLTIVKSAKILPIAYASSSIALIYKATQASLLPEKAVLFSTAALSLINFSLCDNAKLASAKRAYKKTSPASAGRAKQLRQAALTWRTVIRIKIIGQVIGLLGMVLSKNVVNVMCSAAFIMGTNLIVYLCGAGNSWHDEYGNWKPIESGAKTGVFYLSLSAIALIAASAPTSSSKHISSAYFFAARTFLLALEEGLPELKKTFERAQSPGN